MLAGQGQEVLTRVGLALGRLRIAAKAIALLGILRIQDFGDRLLIEPLRGNDLALESLHELPMGQGANGLPAGDAWQLAPVGFG